MPALKILGRSWHIAADDLPLPSLMGTIWHTAIFIFSSVDLSFVTEQLDASCPYRRRHIVYLSCHLTCFVINGVLHLWMFFESSQGSMFQVHCRRRVSSLVLAVLIFHCLTISANVYGTHLVYLQKATPQCEALPGRLRLNHYALLKAIVVSTWVFPFVGFLATIITLNLFSTYQAANSRWLSRFKLYRWVLFCCCYGSCRAQGEDGSTDDGAAGDTSSGRMMSPMVVIANIFTHIFGRVDMTLTDYIAAFTLLGVRHSHSKPAFRYSNAPPPRWLVPGSGARHGLGVAAAPAPMAPPLVMPPLSVGSRGGRWAAAGGVLLDDVVLEAHAVVLPAGRMATDQSPALPEAKMVVEGSASCQHFGALHVAAAEASAGAEEVPAAERIAMYGAAAASAPSPRTPVAATTTTTTKTETTSTETTTIATDGIDGGSIAPTSIGKTTSPTITSVPSPRAEGPNADVRAGVVAIARGLAATTTGDDCGWVGDDWDEAVGGVPVRPSRSPGCAAATAAASKVAAAATPYTPPRRRQAGCRLAEAAAVTDPVAVAEEVQERRDGRQQPQEWESISLAQCNASMEVMEEALHYMRFATAVYGWRMYLWMNRLRVTNCCRLCVGRSCGCCRQSAFFIRGVGPDYGPPEGCCSATKLLEREAITQLTGVADDDILYVCYRNQVGGLLPYYVALDRQRRSLVLGIRGSLSFNDVVTDLLCEPAEYDVPGVPNTDGSGRRVLWAHRGVLQSTRCILRDIQQQGVLAAAIADWPEGAEGQQQLLQQLPSERARAVAQRLKGSCAGFRVVITGHSLGAGAASLLGPLLQKEFPNLRCWAFAPPGGLMSPKAAELTHGICVSVIHAKDMIPRLGVDTMERLMKDLVAVGVHSAVSKLTIMSRLVLLGERPPLEQLLVPPGSPQLEHEQRKALGILGMSRSSSDRSQPDGPSLHVAEQFAGARDFVPPGHMLYVERRRPVDEKPRPHCCCRCNICMVDLRARNAAYVCRWIQAKDLMQAGLVISRSMFLDHLPDNTLDALETAVRQMSADYRLCAGAAAAEAVETAAGRVEGGTDSCGRGKPLKVRPPSPPNLPRPVEALSSATPTSNTRTNVAVAVVATTAAAAAELPV